jgi:hypothetical protein
MKIKRAAQQNKIEAIKNAGMALKDGAQEYEYSVVFDVASGRHSLVTQVMTFGQGLRNVKTEVWANNRFIEAVQA